MKIDFEIATPYGVFRDALTLPDNHELTQEQIEAMQVERAQNWVATIENPPKPESEIVEIDGVRYERVTFEGQILLKPVVDSIDTNESAPNPEIIEINGVRYERIEYEGQIILKPVEG